MTSAVQTQPEAAQTVLTVNNIEVIYDHVILVLKGVSLTVPKGGIVSLVRSAAAGMNKYGVTANCIAPVAKSRMSGQQVIEQARAHHLVFARGEDVRADLDVIAGRVDDVHRRERTKEKPASLLKRASSSE